LGGQGFVRGVSTSGQQELLLFELGQARYGLMSAFVRELFRAVAIAPLPKAPAIVEGIINVRGRVVPVLDIRARFGAPAKPLEPSDWLIVAAAGGRLVAIRVDGATDLVRVDTQRIEESIGVRGAEYVAGVVKLPDGLVLIHDLGTFLSETEGLALDEAMTSSTERAQ
jgi:purine-binding chemotaxis protein CheW